MTIQRDKLNGWTLGVFSVSVVFLVSFAAPSSLWYDTAEFGAVSWRLSLSHPPGHPAHAVWTHMVQMMFPFSDGLFRANVSSCIALALSLTVLFRLLRGLHETASNFSLAAASLTPLTVIAVVEQGIRSEVYAMQLLFSLLIAYACLDFYRTRDRRTWLIVAFLFGLAGANHSYIAVTLLPIPLLFIFGRCCRLLDIVLGIGLGLIGLLLYLYLPLRAQSGGLVGWGNPSDVSSFWTTITGQEWARNLVPDASGGNIGERISLLGGYLSHQIGLPFCIFGLACAVVSIRTWARKRDWVAVAILIVVALPIGLRLGNAFDPQNPDMGGYLALSLVAIISLFVYATNGLLALRANVLIVCGCLIIIVSSDGLDMMEIREDRASERYALALMDDMGPDGLLITGDYSTNFTCWSLQSIFSERPDLAVLFRGQMNRDWLRERAERTHPRLKSILSKDPKQWTDPLIRWELGVQLERLGSLRRQLRPDGLTAGIGRAWPSTDVHAAYFDVFNGASFAGRRFKALLHIHYLTQLMTSGGPKDLVTWHLRQAAALAEGDPLIDEARRRVSVYR